MAIKTAGVFDVDWRAYVACRDDRVYTLTSGEHKGSVVIRRPHIELETAIVGIAPGDKCVYVATADSSIRCFAAKARKQFTLHTPVLYRRGNHRDPPRHRAVDVHAGTDHKFRTLGPQRTKRSDTHTSGSDERRRPHVSGQGFSRRLAGGRTHSSFSVRSLLSGEVNTLCLVTKAGGLIVKMLPRRHELATATYGGGPPPEQDIPLDIPKKTKLYLDQTEREREMAPEMHRRFQQETVNLQVTTAKAYLELLQRGEIAGASVATEKEETKEEEEDKVLVDLRAVVKGLGPFFHLEVEVANLGDESLLQIPILLSYNPEKYKSPKPLIQIGALVPGICSSASLNWSVWM